MDICDLHLHSSFSDGEKTPEEVAQLASEAGLRAAILTDHNSTRGCDRFIAACRERKLETAPGVEISCDSEAGEIHLVGMFLSRDCIDTLEPRFRWAREKKEESNRILADNLKRAGIDVDYEALVRGKEGVGINRSDFGKKICELKKISTVKEAIDLYLDESCGYYVPPERFKFDEMLSILNECGAVSVVAHPFITIKAENVRNDFLKKAARNGLTGMEVRYSEYDSSVQHAAEALAKDLKLLCSGGSDYHGPGKKPEISVGSGTGNLSVPYAFFTALRDRAREA